MNVAELEAAFRLDEQRYAQLTEVVKRTVLEELSSQPRLHVDGRPKQWPSFLRKAILKPSPNRANDMSDRAGVRVVIPENRFRGVVADAVRRRFEVKNYENKSARLRPDQLGYLGEHYDVMLREDGDPELRDLVCEIQVRTIAQGAWAEVAHELVYKRAADLPTPVVRRVYRLIALVEMFDEEAERLHELIALDPAFAEVRMLDVLEPLFLRLAGENYDRQLSIASLGALRPCYEADELARFADSIEDFVTMNEVKLRDIFDRYPRGGGIGPIVRQPEMLVVFERLDTRPLLLRSEWDKSLPPEVLDDLSAIWGKPA